VSNGRAGWRKRPDITDEALADLYADLRSIPAVGREVGIPWTTVRDRLLAAGVELRPKGAREGPHDQGGRVRDGEREAQLEMVRALMTAAPGMPVREIAKCTGMSEQLARTRRDAVQLEMVRRLVARRPDITASEVARELTTRLDVATRRLASVHQAGLRTETH
jgi:predicted DNA-binding transcriptional regulator